MSGKDIKIEVRVGREKLHVSLSMGTTQQWVVEVVWRAQARAR